MKKQYKIEVQNFTSHDVHVVNERMKRPSGNRKSIPKLAERIRSEISREKINHAWRSANSKRD